MCVYNIYLLLFASYYICDLIFSHVFSGYAVADMPQKIRLEQGRLIKASRQRNCFSSNRGARIRMQPVH